MAVVMTALLDGIIDVTSRVVDITMLEDAVKEEGLEEKLTVRDISEIVTQTVV